MPSAVAARSAPRLRMLVGPVRGRLGGRGRRGFDAAIRARRFDSAGGPVGTEFAVGAPGLVQTPAVAMAPNGNVVVVWEARCLEGGEIVGRLWSSAGSPFGTEFVVND